MRLSRLDDTIQNAWATRQAIATQINEILREKPVDDSSKMQEEAALASKYLAAERKLLKQSLKKCSELKQSLAARKQAIERGQKAQAIAQVDVNSAIDRLQQSCKLLQATKEDIHGQRRRICEELLHIFPIEPTSRPLLF